MDTIQKQVSRARHRLVLDQFLALLVYCLFGALCLAVVGIIVPKLMVIESLPDHWDVGCLVMSGLVGVFSAVAATWVRQAGALDAAIEIDRRFGLDERLASSLQLSAADLESEAGRALLNDTRRRVERVEVGERFRIRLGRYAWLPLVPTLLAFAAMTVLEDRTAESKAVVAARQQEVERARKSVEQLTKKLQQKRADAAEKGLKDAESILKQLEKTTRELSEQKDVGRKPATVKLSDLAEQIENRRKALGDQQSFKQQLKNLKKLSKGPADKLADAIKQGDFKTAIDEVKKLQEQLQKGSLDEDAQKQLAKQMEEMKQKMQEMADSHQQAMQDLKQQVEKLREQGQTQQAAQLQQQLAQMTERAPQMKQMQQMADQLGQMQQAMEDGDPQQAGEAMQQLAQQLENMQQEMAEMEMLGEALEQIADAKQAMGCQQCQGMGCEACQGGFGENANGPPGMGMGKGRGKGPRPDEENATNFRDSQVRDQPKNGRAVITGEAHGPNVKGQVQEQIKDAMSAQARAQADPLTTQRLPRTQREHAEEYFNSLRGDSP